MKLALPLTADDRLPEHFGDAAKFEVFDLDLEQRRVRRRLIVVPAASRPCQWPRLLRRSGVEQLLVQHIGQSALTELHRHQVDVLTGVFAAPPEELVSSWLAGELRHSPAPAVCQHCAHT
ncbi:NifB/NifX family molybdenum-iron cluster-binding protein [Actomonas aquatica]|uniref:NifB/NifX family molybdenum-iron cluster-binding protein n=1 Tax=Actomonas aquatica TaxID=2866162 RepID=A0ABZ1C750_9BACT|nr:NifB/NifX family molybdenum-iron cluster-binding protein [Opitutus sp. WL0086]WRQ86334.1 NifB/NifX family molybdenum-iron cluster-binding protein [Opitutus sp. WL0086]